MIIDCQNDIEDYYDFLTDCAVRYISLNCFFLSLKQPRKKFLNKVNEHFEMTKNEYHALY